MAQRDDTDRQQQQGSTGQRSEGEGGGHRQADLPGEHGGQQGGKAGVGDKGQREQQDVKRPPGSNDRSGGEQQLQQDAQGARPTQGNLGTTQREWSPRDNVADSDEQ